jgi:hypothetical protein
LVGSVVEYKCVWFEGNKEEGRDYFKFELFGSIILRGGINIAPTPILAPLQNGGICRGEKTCYKFGLIYSLSSQWWTGNEETGTFFSSEGYRRWTVSVSCTGMYHI